MATQTVAEAAARLKAVTGQASLANALSRGRLMNDSQLVAAGIDPKVLAKVTPSSGISPATASGQPRSIASFIPNASNTPSRIGTATNLNPANPLKPVVATPLGQSRSVTSFLTPPQADRGSDPAFQAANDTSYAPTLDQEQAQAQANAQPVGSSTYTPNPPVNPGGPNVPSGTASNIPDLITTIPTVALPNAPDIHIGWHDFTTQANQKAAAAYAPLYTAIAGAQTQAQKQAADAGAQVKGMYANLDAQTAKDKTATAANYAGQVAAATKAGQTQQNDISSAFNSTAKDTAAIMAAAGLGNAQGTAAADTMATTANQRTAAQTNAAAASAENVANVKAQGGDQANFLTNTQNADRTAGISAQAGITKDLGNVMQQYANQKLSTTSDQMQQALALNQQMGQNDFGAQTASASQANSQFANAMSRASFQQNANMNAVTLQNAGITNQQNRAAAAAAAAQAAAIAQMNYNEKIYSDNVTLAGQQTKATTAQGQTAAATNTANLDRASREAIAAMHLDQTNPNSPANLAANNAYTQFQGGIFGIANNDPATAQTLEAFIPAQAAAAQKQSGGQIDYQKFMDDSVKAAQAQGLKVTPDQVRRAVTAYQKLMNGRSLLLNNPLPATTYGGTTATSGG